MANETSREHKVLFHALVHDQEIRKNVLSWFRRLFNGNPDGYYVHLGEKKYRAVKGAPTDEQIIDHLIGRGNGLLSAPVRPADGTVRFAAIDVDQHELTDPPVHHTEIAAKVAQLGLPLILTRTKRNGAHLWLFFKGKEGFPAAQASELMSRYVTLLGLSDNKFEIFPKQKKGGFKYGSGINLPYHGIERGAIGQSGEELDLMSFFELAGRRISYGSILAMRHLRPEPAASSPWTAASEQPDRPMTVEQIRTLHKANLEKFQGMKLPTDFQNKQLFICAKHAARAFAADALEGTEESIKKEIVDIALSSGHCDGIEATFKSGWNSGIDKPLAIINMNPAEDPAVALVQLNGKFFIVKNYGNRCRVAWLEEETHEELKGMLKLGHQSFADFTNALCKEQVFVGIDKKGNPILIPKARWWLEHPKGRQYWRVVFLPGREVSPDLLNLWRGFAFEPRKGDCNLYLEHLRNIICNGNEAHYEYTIKWMSRAVKFPWERGHTALVWRGDKGPGKNLAAETFGKLFGSHYMTITNAEHLVGRFNAHLRAKCVLIANEAFYAGNKQHESTLKGLITDPVLPIEQKFVDAETDVNLLHLIILSNNEWVIPVSDRERRFFMVDVSGEKIGQYDYFQAIMDQLTSGGYEALLYHLLNEVDISDFNPRNVPHTAALRSQMAESLTGIEEVWYECLCRGELPGTLNKDDTVWLRGSELVDWAAKHNPRKWSGLRVEHVGHLLGKNPRLKNKGMGFGKMQLDLPGTGQRNQGWLIPKLKQARDVWESKRFEQDWGDEVTEWRKVE